MSPAHLQAVAESEEPAGPARSGGGGGSGRSVEERLSALETHMKYLATKEDLQKLKVWILGGVIGAAVLGIVVSLTAVRLLQ